MKTRPMVIRPLSTDPHIVARRKKASEVQELMADAYNYRFLDDETTRVTPCSKICKTLGRLYKGLLISNSTGCDTATVTLGIKKQERDLLGFIPCANLNVGFISAFYFAQSCAVNGPEISEGINNTAEILSTRSLPAEWKKLSLGKEIFAGSLSFLFAMYSALAEGTATYGFLTDPELDINKTLATVLAVLYVKSSLASESRTSWEKTRNLFIHSDEDSAFKPSKILSYPLATFSGAGAVILGFDGIQSTFSIERQGVKTAIFVIGLTKGATDGSYSEKKNHEALDGVLTEIAKGKCPSLFQIVAIGGSIFFGSIVADSLTVIYTGALATAALPFTMPLFLPPIIGYGIGVSQGVTAAYGTHSFLTFLKNKIVNAFCCRSRKHREDIEDANESDELNDENNTALHAEIKNIPDLENPKPVALPAHPSAPKTEAVAVQPEKYYRQQNRHLQFAAPDPARPTLIELTAIPTQATSPKPRL